MNTNKSKITNHVELKVKTRKEIACELGVSLTTLWRHLKKHDINLPSGLVYPNKQKEIYKLFGNEIR